MQRLSIGLEDEEHSALEELARRERRGVRQQAGSRESITDNERGLLPQQTSLPCPTDADPRRARSGRA
jgi:hypothetical protein